MPKLRKPPAAAETPPADTQLRTGTRIASEQQLHNYETLETEINEPVEIDISEDADDSAPQAPARVEPTREKDEGALAAQARESKQAEDALKRAQEDAYRAREAYERQQAAYAQERQARQRSDLDSVTAHLGAAQSDFESAQRAYINARQANDYENEMAAQSAMMDAKVRMGQLEEGKRVMEQQATAQPPVAQYPSRDAAAIVNGMQALIPEERAWLLKHPELVTNPQRVQELQGTYNAAQRQGLARGTDEYFQFFEERLGLSEPEAPPSKPAKPVRAQAPVSRSTTDLRSGRQNEGNKITLSAQQRQAAQWSGISETEYARELKKLRDLKGQGFYTDNQ